MMMVVVVVGVFPASAPIHLESPPPNLQVLLVNLRVEKFNPLKSGVTLFNAPRRV